MSDFLTLDEIEAQAPAHSDGEPTAFYSVGCCWWATNHHDLGAMPGTDKGPLGALPCCPHCYSVLYQAPLADYLAAARLNPDHYGEFGLMALAKAHATNVPGCAPLWRVYNFVLEVEKSLDMGTGWLAQVNLYGPGIVKIGKEETKR